MRAPAAGPSTHAAASRRPRGSRRVRDRGRRPEAAAARARASGGLLAFGDIERGEAIGVLLREVHLRRWPARGSSRGCRPAPPDAGASRRQDPSRSGSRPPRAAPPARLRACGCPARDTAPRRRECRPARPSSPGPRPPVIATIAGVRPAFGLARRPPTVDIARLSLGFRFHRRHLIELGAVPDHHLERFDVGRDGGAEERCVVEPVGVGHVRGMELALEPLVRIGAARRAGCFIRSSAVSLFG